LLLAHLPVSYLTDPASVENNLDIMDQGKKKKHNEHSIDVITHRCIKKVLRTKKTKMLQMRKIKMGILL
jgi:hypothetical protein